MGNLTQKESEKIVIHKCLAVWADLIGYIDMIRPSNLDLRTEVAKAAIER